MQIPLRSYLLAALLLLLCAAPIHGVTHDYSLTPFNNTDARTILLHKGYTEIPLYWSTQSKTLLIEATLPHQPPQWLIVDTGAVVTTIDPKALPNHQHHTINSITLNGIDHRHTTANKITLPQLQLAQFTSHQDNVYLADRSFIRNIGGRAVIGTLGLDFLHAHFAVLDLANRRLYLKSPSNAPLPLELTRYQTALRAQGYHALSLQRAPSGNQTLLTQVNDAKPVAFIIDSGSPFTLVSLRYAKTLELPLAKTTRTVIGSGGGILELFNAPIHNLAVQHLAWSLFNIAAVDYNYLADNTPLFGILGVDWLEKNRAIINFADDQAFVQT